MKSLYATLVMLLLAAVPASAQTMSTLLPALSWPEDGMTALTKACEPASGQTVCTITK